MPLLFIFFDHLQWSMSRISVPNACFLVFNQGIQSGMIDHIASYIRPFHEWLAQAGCSTCRWVACYRAIEHGWSSRAFHEACQQDGASVVLVRKNSFIFGGFSDTSWNFKGRSLRGESDILELQAGKVDYQQQTYVPVFIYLLYLICTNYSAEWR